MKNEKNVFKFKIPELTADCGCTLTQEIGQLLGLSGL